MASSVATPVLSNELAEKAEGLDVDWLIKKKDQNGLKRAPSTTKSGGSNTVPKSNKVQTPTQTAQLSAETTIATPVHSVPHPPVSNSQAQRPTTPQTNGSSQSPAIIVIPQGPVSERGQPSQQSTPQDDAKHSRLSLKDKGRRSSWFSSLGSKLSGSSEKPGRKDSISSPANDKKSPKASPAFEPNNPFEAFGKNVEEEQKPVTSGARRPSVLVAAGTETKLDSSPGFLGALRRLSSGNTATLGKAAGSNGTAHPRRIMNIDHNRQRTKIADFDQNKLRRVAFKVDVEIAGVAAQADEHHDGDNAASKPLASDKTISNGAKDAKMAKLKDKSEGAALKESIPKPGEPENVQSAISETQEEQKMLEIEQRVEDAVPNRQSPEVPDEDTPATTRKKEKKKRSEAERKERKEKKRRQAEANGLIPLELTLEDDSDSSHLTTAPPTGANTPRKGLPTTDPLRIYKRCCQLRETSALAIIKEQISKPSATLAEAPGTVASIDLSGSDLILQDVQTLGDWLAIVPVRRLILDDCNLSDEALRIILSGLSGCKSQDQARANRKLPRGINGKPGIEQMGVIERLSLKNNAAISRIGWRHIALFMHLCKSLRAIDLSGLPFPANSAADLSRTSTTTTSMSGSQELPPTSLDWSQLFARAVSERLGGQLDELVLNGCGLSTSAVSEVVDSAIKCKIKRLGLANTDMSHDALGHVVRYVLAGVCEGLDMGGNNLNGVGHLLTEHLEADNPLFAMSLAGCNLSVDDLRAILHHLSDLQNFKFIDLSRNEELFETEDDVVSLLRRRLPKMKELKRLHLSDVNMSPNQLISLAEIFPDCPSLAHVSILDNQKLVQCMNSKEGESQEEACAVFVSLMSAVRASKTLVAVEIEVPSQDSSEVIKALASQVVAYSLRNLERTTLSDLSGVEVSNLDKHAPEVLLHLVGHMEGYEDIGNDEPAPDEDYVIASTGIVKALGVCLENKESSRMHSRNISPAASGTVTPRSGTLRPQNTKKPRDVSLELCESARKIRRRLRPAMLKEDRAGNIDAYRRLFYLDQTLERTIKRFEDEYPASRPKDSPSMVSLDSRNSSYNEPPPDLSQLTDHTLSTSPDGEDPFSVRLSRTSSNTSLAARALTQEEGRMHRFGQSMRREVLKPSQVDDVLHGTSTGDGPEAAHLAALRRKLEAFSGEEIRTQVASKGVDEVIRELDINSMQLKAMMKEDPEGFEQFRDSQMAAEINSGRSANS